MYHTWAVRPPGTQMYLQNVIAIPNGGCHASESDCVVLTLVTTASLDLCTSMHCCKMVCALERRQHMEAAAVCEDSLFANVSLRLTLNMQVTCTCTLCPSWRCTECIDSRRVITSRMLPTHNIIYLGRSAGISGLNTLLTHTCPV